MTHDTNMIETACLLLSRAISILDQASEDVEASCLSLSLERLTEKHKIVVGPPCQGEGQPCEGDLIHDRT